MFSYSLASVEARAPAVPHLSTAALGVVLLHVVDTEFLQPQPGTGPRDPLLSAALPIALTVAGWFVFGRVRRPGLRAAPGAATSTRRSTG